MEIYVGSGNTPCRYLRLLCDQGAERSSTMGMAPCTKYLPQPRGVKPKQ